ncbi:MAG: hypothetical protein GY820_42190 [Gammaproteobacteria bacterium]|nr:hypothetical protein [Gammaproteobacteria bacterium]
MLKRQDKKDPACNRSVLGLLSSNDYQSKRRSSGMLQFMRFVLFGIFLISTALVGAGQSATHREHSQKVGMYFF